MLRKIFLSSAILLLASGCGMLDRVNSNNTTITGYKKEMQSSFDTIFFKFDNSSISNDAMVKLDFQVDYLKKHGDSKIRITGFCDERGTREYNIALGERRANAVKKYLVEKGISASRIVVDSMGKEVLRCDTTNPIYNVVDGDVDIYHKQNRRALIIPEDGTIDYDMIASQERGRCLSPYHKNERKTHRVVNTKVIGEKVGDKVISEDEYKVISDSEEEDGQYLPVATEVCDKE